MRFADRDAILQRLAGSGKAGGVPITADAVALKRSIDTLWRRAGEIENALTQMLDVDFLGPVYGEGANVFRIDARPTSAGFNILTVAQATVEVGIAADGFAIFKHGLNMALDQYEVAAFDVASPLDFAGAAALQPWSVGGVRRYGWDNARTIFQLDELALAQEAVVTLCLFPSKRRPVNNVSPTLSGAARINNELVVSGSFGMTTKSGT